MTAQLQSPWIYLADSDGEPLAGAKVRVYEPGTTTELDVFSDEEATVVVNQPIIADAAGRITRYFVTQKYKMTVHTSADVLVTTIDDQDPGLPSGFGVSATVQIEQGGTGATTASAARSNLGAASNAALTALQTQVTGIDTKVDTGLNDGDPTRFGLLAKEDEVTPELASGIYVPVKLHAHTTTIATNTTTSTIPVDNTIPQAGEGATLIDTVSITPERSDSTIEVDVLASFQGTSASAEAVIALIKDGAANAVSAAVGVVAATDRQFQVRLKYRIAPGSTSTITFRVNFGVNGGTLRVNGSGDDTLGGVIAGNTYMRIMEWVQR